MNRPDYLAILRADEKTAPWLDHLDRIGAPDAPVALPDGGAFTQALRDLDVPEDDVATMVRLRGDLVADQDLGWLLDRSVHSLLRQMDTVDEPHQFPALPDAFGEIGRFFFAYVYVAMLPHTRAVHRRRDVPEAVTLATMADVGRHFHIHRLETGTHGLSNPDWMMLHARGVLYQLGRLQFERGRLGNRTSQGIAAAGFPCEHGELVIAVHIPGLMGPMSPEACDASFAEARAFFRMQYPEESPRLAVCSSWLLDDQLARYLPDSSNIIQFQRRFRLAYRGEDDDRDTIRFVFRLPDRPIGDLPQRTTLERAVVRHIRDGGHWRRGVGWLEW